jgi:hypothetical protein
MVVHTCIRCKRDFGKKSAYIDHTNRKNPCKEKIVIIEETDLKNDIEDEIEQIHQQPPGSTNLNLNLIDVPPILTCLDCSKTFTRSDALKRHVDSRCKVKKEKAKNDSILLQKIKELEEENKVIKQKINILETTKTNKKTKNPTQIINNNINNINITNNNIVNNLANFGTIDNSKVGNDFFYYSLTNFSGLKPLIKFVEFVHKNKKMKEYNNVRITDLGRNLGQIVENKVWVVEDANEITNKVIDETYNYYEVKFDELDEEINEKTQLVKTKIKRNKRFICCMRGSDMFDLNDDGDYVDDDGNKVSPNDLKNGKKFEDKLKKQVKMLLKM